MEPSGGFPAPSQDAGRLSTPTAIFVRPDHTVRRTLWGITLLGACLGVAAASLIVMAVAPGMNLIGSWTLFAITGFAFLLAYPEVFSPLHRRLVQSATALGVVAIFVGLATPFLASTIDMSAPAQHAGNLRWSVAGETAFVLLASVAVFLATYAVQDRLGRVLLVAGLAAAVVVQVFLLIGLNEALNRAVSEWVPNVYPTTLDRFPSTWSRLGGWNALPLVIDLIAFERLYWQLRRKYLPGVSLLEA